MGNIETFGLLIIALNFFMSYKAFSNFELFDKYKFEIDKILKFKDYKRLFTSGFIHVNWTHLILNMFSLFAFSGLLEKQIGGLLFLLVYFVSLCGGNLLALFVHRNHSDYSAVGASGAVCGIIFASIALFPDLGISLFLIPIAIPSWLYGLAYVLYSIYGIKSKKDNIGHEAHLGGALAGMIFIIIIQPTVLLNNLWPILLVTIPTIIFIYLIITKPEILLVDNLFFKSHKKYYNIDHKYNEEKINKQNEIDLILEKISKKGIDSLSKKEKLKLDEFSKTNV